MRAIVVLCLAFAVVAAQEEGGAPESTLACIHKALKSSIDASKGNMLDLLQKLSPKENIANVLSQITVEYDALLGKVDNSTRVVLEDRSACEERNLNAIFKRKCNLLAKISFLQMNTKNVYVLVKNTISIITRAHIDFAKGNVISGIRAFTREQAKALIASVSEAVACIQKKA